MSDTLRRATRGRVLGSVTRPREDSAHVAGMDIPHKAARVIASSLCSVRASSFRPRCAYAAATARKKNGRAV